MPKPFPYALIVAVLLATAIGRAQEPGPTVPSGPPVTQPTDPAPIPDPIAQVQFRAGADLVVLHVSVRDRRGRDLDGLPERAFSVFEDDVRQPVTVFTNEDAPVTVGLIIDSSVSMLPIREQVIHAATAFAEASHPRDDMFALAFNELVRPSLPEDAPFTADPVTLRNALLASVSARGRTALFDALSAGLDYVARGRYERRMLIVISDGGDNASRMSFEKVNEKMLASNAVVFTVALQDPYGSGGNPRMMRAIAEASGGQAFTPRNVQEVSEALAAIAHELRHSYMVGYAAPHPEVSRYRRVRVGVTAPQGQRVTVRTRPGYGGGQQRSSDDTN